MFYIYIESVEVVERMRVVFLAQQAYFTTTFATAIFATAIPRDSVAVVERMRDVFLAQHANSVLQLACFLGHTRAATGTFCCS